MGRKAKDGSHPGALVQFAERLRSIFAEYDDRGKLNTLLVYIGRDEMDAVVAAAKRIVHFTHSIEPAASPSEEERQ